MWLGPYRRLAVAVSLSPRREALLAEAGYLAEQMGAELVVIHVGRPSEHTYAHLEALMERQHLDGPGCKLYFPSGPPAKAIARICQQEAVDLLVLGALPTQSTKDAIFGTVAQDTLRLVNCSVLLLANPRQRPKHWQEVAIATNTLQAEGMLIEKTVRMAQALGADHVHLLVKDGQGADDLPVITRRRQAASSGLAHARHALDPFEGDLLEEAEHPVPDLHIKLFAGALSRACQQFMEKHPVEVLALEAPPAEAMRYFWRWRYLSLSRLVALLPTNLLLVR